MKLHEILKLILTILARILLVNITVINMKNDVNIKIYDISGKLIRNYSSTNLHSQQIKWDARDNSGRIVPNGMYFIRLQTYDSKSIEKIILLE